MGEEGSAGQWWEWWIGTGPAGAATWAGTILSAIGLVITIVGFLAAIKEAKAAKQQASAAVTAVGRLKSSLGASSLAYTHSQVGLLVQFVDGCHFHPAHILLSTVQREMLHHASDIQATANTVADLKKRLKTVSTHIGHAQAENGKFNAGTLRNALTGVQQTIVDWENALRQTAGEVSK
ncbi:hypothetical protein AB9F41_11575 [Rhizobium leguminosarum]|uniref:hypothetical protein n=1 Tax=Rhizobium leguminosarum TaxID=384 RepID=UPI003F9D90CA